jgi:hypothetical protein
MRRLHLVHLRNSQPYRAGSRREIGEAACGARQHARRLVILSFQPSGAIVSFPLPVWFAGFSSKISSVRHDLEFSFLHFD